MPCPHCQRPYPAKHIGKSSAGWCFALHVIPEEGIHGLEDWEARWDLLGTLILDEYGEITSPSTMRAIITDRSIPGPNNLLRAKIKQTQCIGHGEGTWDLIIGDFS